MKHLYAAMQSTRSRSRQLEANTHVVLACTETDGTEWHYAYARVVALLPGSHIAVMIRDEKHAGDHTGQVLDLLYGMFSDVYTMAELRQIVVSNPFDRSEHPRQLKLVELTDWLEALVA